MTPKSMKRIAWILLLVAFTGCQTEDCTEWYAGLKVSPVTLENNGNERIGDWYITDFLENELNFETTFHFSADGYEVCRSKIRIHELETDSTNISCQSNVVIENDTVQQLTNLINYFDLIETSGHMLFTYKSKEYDFPHFEQQETIFYFKFTLSDNQILKDSCVVKIIQ